MLFMGEEHADPAPFLYFTDHGDPALQRAVSEGRRREFGAHSGDVPDPQAQATFERSRIQLALGHDGRHAGVRHFYQALLALRRQRQSLRALDKTRTEAFADDDARTLVVRRWHDTDETLVLISLSPKATVVRAPAPREGRWRAILDAGDAKFAGPRSARLHDRSGALEVELPPFGVLICSDR